MWNVFSAKLCYNWYKQIDQGGDIHLGKRRKN